MLPRILFIFIAISLLAAGPAPGAELSAADLFKKTAPSIATLTVTAKDGKTYIGTAFMAEKEGMAVTAWHVVQGAASVSAKFSDGQEFDVSGLVDNDPKRDIALIRIKVFGRKQLRLSPVLIPVGSKAFAIGAPLGLEFSISDGLVSQVRQSDGMNIYQISCPISHGNSGGPVLNNEGEVIGVVSFQFTEGQNLNFAVPSTYVLGLDATLPTKPWDQVKILPPTDSGVSTADQPDAAINSDLDAELASSIAVNIDTAIALNYQSYRLRQNENGFKGQISPALYQARDEAIRHLAKLQNATSNDPLRERVRIQLVSILDGDIKVITTFTQAIRDSQEANYWLASSNDLISQSIATYKSAVQCKLEDIKSLLSSQSFSKAVPLLTSHYQRTDTFVLGIRATFADNLFVCVVESDGIGDKIGIKPGDRLQKVDDAKIASCEELREHIKASVGKRIKLTVVRDGKIKTLEAEIPN